ncbi:MAG: hypothetical protein D6759_15785 [Chloroflexi bacterium]|nr:MAG: hypothetical protein D6759_15785 [Chloroflexota bacterium]
MRPEDRNTDPRRRPSTHQFRIQMGNPFTVFLILRTGYREPYPVLVSLFLDYEQVPFALDGRRGLLHYLEIPPDVDMEIPLEVPVKGAGRHDLFIIVFPEPDAHPTDPQKRLPPSFVAGGRRTVICVESCAEPARSLPQAMTAPKADVHRLNVLAFPLLPGHDGPPQRRLLLVTTVEKGEALEVELWARNPGARPRDYVVLPLMDFGQTTFADAPLLHLHLPPHSELFIPGRIPLPREEGVHELQFITIFDPYRDLERVSDPFVNANLRSAIVVAGPRSDNAEDGGAE